MDLRGEAVVHKSFGKGHIVKFANNYLTVLFDDIKETKMFVYPSVFGEFLELENDSFQVQIEKDKEVAAQEMARNRRINEELKKHTMLYAPPAKAKAKPRKAAKAKPTV
jgi:hypothetical protein